jgi:hypothetical protein
MTRTNMEEQRAAAADRTSGPRPPISAAPAPLAAAPAPLAAAPASASTAGVDPNRFSLLKKPPADRPDPLAALRAIQTPAAQR